MALVREGRTDMTEVGQDAASTYSLDHNRLRSPLPTPSEKGAVLWLGEWASFGKYGAHCYDQQYGTSFAGAVQAIGGGFPSTSLPCIGQRSQGEKFMDVIPQSPPYYATVDIGGGYWMTISEAQRTAIFNEHVNEAKNILAEHQLNAPDSFIEAVVEAALKEFHIRAMAGLDEPDPDHWHDFFDEFVPMACFVRSVGAHCGNRLLDQIVDATPSKKRRSRKHPTTHLSAGISKRSRCVDEGSFRIAMRNAYS